MDAAAILLVEDRAIVVDKIRREVERAGFQVAGMAASQATAIKLAGELALDAAILDVDLRGRPIYPIAQVLRGRGVPFLFLTGYSVSAIPEPWRDVPLIEKPFEGEVLIRTLREVLAGGRVDPAAERMSTPAIRRAWERVRHTRDILTEQRAWAERRAEAKPPAD